MNERKKEIYRVTLIGTLLNIVLSVGKLAAGIIGRSGAMVADAVHSFSDFATDLVVLIFVKVSSKPKDEDHPYGHGKFETLATVIIGMALFAVAIGIIVNAVGLILKVLDGGVISRPGLIALIAAAVSIVSKEWLFWFTVKTGRKVKSPVVIANAWHHRSDAFSSIGTLIGIGGAYFLSEKWRVLDPIAAIVVGALIIKVAYDLIVPGINELLEKSLPQNETEEIIHLVVSCGGVSDPHNVRARRVGASVAVEMHVRVEPSMSVAEAHEMTREIEKKLKGIYGIDTLINIHVEPKKC